MQKMNNKTGFEQIEKIIESRLEMQTRDAGIILDISMLPFFEKIITAKRKEKITIFVPDTIKKLISKGEKNRQYYFYLTRLIDRWTEREVDINFLKKIVLMDTQDFNEKFRNVNLKFIEKKDCDEIIYNSCIKEIEVKEFSIEFSPRFNILGDVVGKILGAAQKSKSPVLMMNRRLLNEARKTIPVLDTAKKYAKMKRDFFDETIPGLKRTSGIRTFIGIIIGGTGFMYGNLPLTALGFVFAVLDP